MDIPNLLKKYWYLPLILLYIWSAILKFESEGWAAFITPTGISLITAILLTVYNNFRPMRRLFRKLKYFIGTEIFRWDLNSVFLIRQSTGILDLTSEMKKLIEKTLKANEIKLSANDDLEISKDSFNRLEIFIAPISTYISVSETDADLIDSESFSLKWLNVRIRTSLRYKSTKKIINNFMVDLLKEIEEKFTSSEEKYTLKIDLEGRKENFFKEQFLKEVDAKEVTNFSITIKSSRSNQVITNKNISITTNRREELVDAVENIILRIN